MGYDISGVKNKERQREKLSADCGWKPAWEQTDKNKAAINILKGKDEVESLDFNSSIAGGGGYDNLIGKFLKEQIPAVGFSIGFERIYSILMEKEAYKTEKQKK